MVAGNTVANHRRAGHRGAAAHSELARLQRAAGPGTGADVTATERVLALSRLAALTPKERAAVLLVSWDGLEPAEAAQVAGCTVTAFHVRLHRARKRLQSSVDHGPDDEPDQTTTSSRTAAAGAGPTGPRATSPHTSPLSPTTPRTLR